MSIIWNRKKILEKIPSNLGLWKYFYVVLRNLIHQTIWIWKLPKTWKQNLKIFKAFIESKLIFKVLSTTEYQNWRLCFLHGRFRPIYPNGKKIEILVNINICIFSRAKKIPIWNLSQKVSQANLLKKFG